MAQNGAFVKEIAARWHLRKTATRRGLVLKTTTRGRFTWKNVTYDADGDDDDDDDDDASCDGSQSDDQNVLVVIFVIVFVRRLVGEFQLSSTCLEKVEWVYDC